MISGHVSGSSVTIVDVVRASTADTGARRSSEPCPAKRCRALEHNVGHSGTSTATLLRAQAIRQNKPAAPGSSFTAGGVRHFDSRTRHVYLHRPGRRLGAKELARRRRRSTFQSWDSGPSGTSCTLAATPGFPDDYSPAAPVSYLPRLALPAGQVPSVTGHDRGPDPNFKESSGGSDEPHPAVRGARRRSQPDGRDRGTGRRFQRGDPRRSHEHEPVPCQRRRAAHRLGLPARRELERGWCGKRPDDRSRQLHPRAGG